MNTSERFWRALRLVLAVVVLPLVTLVAVGGVLRWAATRWEVRPQAAPLAPTAVGQGLGTPSAPPPALDSALLGALAAAQAEAHADPLAMLILDVPPLGVYLPLSGDAQFALPTPTPTPALTPLPTATPTLTPSATPSGSPTPSVTPPPSLTPMVLLRSTYATLPPNLSPYGGLNCAPSGWPVAGGALTQYFHGYHRAIDIGVPLYTPVVATHSGVVKFAGWRTDGYGNLIIVESGLFTTYYAHLSDFNVVSGQVVGRGALIGWSGSTGNSSGPHIHYEIRLNGRETDPLSFERLGYPPC